MIHKLIDQGESKTIEFKASMPQNNQIAQTVCAFANRAGGYLIFGVSDNGTVLGLTQDQIDEYVEKIPNIIHDSVFPMILPEIYTYGVEKKTVLIVQVYPGSSVPYYIKSKGKQNGTYVRVGRTNKLADVEMINELERQKINRSFDEDLFDVLKPSDEKALIGVLESQFNKTISRDTLKSLKLIDQTGEQVYMTNAGAILLGELSNTTVKCARFLGESIIDFIDQKEYRGNVFEVLENILIFLKNHLNLAGVIKGSGLQRRDVLEIPESVLREGILNALMHRDYSISGSDIKVAVFDSKIEITSPGGFPKSLTADDIYTGRSEIRNKALSKIFLRTGHVEHWGSGIPRIRELCGKMGLKEPEIEENGLYVTLRIYRKNAWVRESVSPYDKPSKSKTQIIEEEQDQILELIRENSDLTVKDISHILQITPASAQRRLKSMQDQKLIKRVGSKKTGKWEVGARG